MAVLACVTAKRRWPAAQVLSAKIPIVDGWVTFSTQYRASVQLRWSIPVLDLDELRELAADVRVFIDLAEDKAAALRDIIAAYDVVLGIYPSGDEIGLHVVKGTQILDQIAKSQTSAMYTHTAIAVPDLRHAESLRQLTTPCAVKKLAA
jgi:hypothetical protein